MQKLNAQCDGEKIEAKLVAKKFLQDNNYFEYKKVNPLKKRICLKIVLKSKLKTNRM